MLSGTLDDGLLGNLLTGKGFKQSKIPGQWVMQAGEGPVKNTNYQNEPKFNGVYSRNILLKIKDETYVIDLDEYKTIGNQWIAWSVNDECCIFW